MFIVQTNGRIKSFFYTAILHVFPLQVQYKPYSISTILAFKDVENITEESITIDKSKKRAMFVTLEGKSYKFRECTSGKYY